MSDCENKRKEKGLKPCKPSQICNPKTTRCVSRTGAKGKEILGKTRSKSRSSRSKSKAKRSKSKSRRSKTRRSKSVRKSKTRRSKMRKSRSRKVQKKSKYDMFKKTKLVNIRKIMDEFDEEIPNKYLLDYQLKKMEQKTIGRDDFGPLRRDFFKKILKLKAKDADKFAIIDMETMEAIAKNSIARAETLQLLVMYEIIKRFGMAVGGSRDYFIDIDKMDAVIKKNTDTGSNLKQVERHLGEMMDLMLTKIKSLLLPNNAYNEEWVIANARRRGGEVTAKELKERREMIDNIYRIWLDFEKADPGQWQCPMEWREPPEFMYNNMLKDTLEFYKQDYDSNFGK